MTRTTRYDTWTNHNTQDELQKLAGDIFQYGTITEVIHHGYSTNRNNGADGEMEHIKNGSLCYMVEGLKGSNTRYWIHTQGCRVAEIIEEITYNKGVKSC